jgi:Type II CAAX prenyl endopeptidase Rce1-like
VTAAIAPLRSRTTPYVNVAVAAVAAAGCGLLAARPALLASVPRPSATLVVLFGALLVVGLAMPVPRAGERASVALGGRAARLALGVGVLAFAAGRVIGGGSAPVRFTLPVVLANSLAAVAEEVWFRKVCFALLAPAGPGVAIAGTTLLFAAVHVAVYGLWVVPLDLAAGALLGWQRAVTGSWTVPAVTHVIANLLVVL